MTIHARSTVFSLSHDPPVFLPTPSPELAGEPDCGRLVGAGGEHRCTLVRLSAAGATLQVDGALEIDGAYALELSFALAIPGRIQWLREGQAGLRFDLPIDVVATLARNLVSLPAERRRGPRIELRQGVWLHRGDDHEFAHTRDLSQTGVGIETRLPLEPGEAVQLTLDGLRPIDGAVKWVQAGGAGIAFAEELGWQVLMPWLRQVQQGNARRPEPQRAIGEPEPSALTDKQTIRMNTPGRVREGVRWWNVQIRGLTSALVEFESGRAFGAGTGLWISLPGVGGWPARVVEGNGRRYLAEFRLPLRPHELGRLSEGRPHG